MRTASERLRELEREIAALSYAGPLNDLLEALPLIAGVVETAEQAETRMGTQFSLRPKSEWAKLHLALAALRDSLNGSA